ncbi:MAG: DUF3592 domain-containing protein [Solobacterium sp.]|nr:DUF3592 domain-containing protein [Solobacterium sp.]
MTEFSRLLMYVPGIVIFLVGSGQVRTYLRLHRKNAVTGGTVTECKRIIQKDKQGRVKFDYYNVTAEYRDPETRRKCHATVKSAAEFLPGQGVTMYLGGKGVEPVFADADDESMFNPWVTMACGALLILLVLFEERGQEPAAMACLSGVMIIGGAAMLLHSYLLKRRNLEPVEAVITDVYKRQISKESKIIKGARYTYYPIVRYTYEGREGMRRCDVNASREDAFKKGETMTLYYDPTRQMILEKKASTLAMAGGAVILAAGILAGVSILSVL